MSTEIMITARARKGFVNHPEGTFVGKITEVEVVYTDPVRTKSPWTDSARQVRYRFQSEDGTVDYYTNLDGFVHAGDPEIELLLKNMSIDKIKQAGLTASAYKAMSRDAKYNAMFEEVPSDAFNGEKKPYVLFKHGRTRIISDKNTEIAQEITGSVPFLAGVAEDGEQVNLSAVKGAMIGFTVVTGPNGNSKVSKVMTVDQASA